jgi:bacterioferritin
VRRAADGPGRAAGCGRRGARAGGGSAPARGASMPGELVRPMRLWKGTGGMKGSQTIIDLLNDVLTGELTAVNQYWVHARMCENWGYHRLWEKIRHEAIDEMKHADELVARVLYLDGHPNLQRLGNITVGQTVKEQLELDLKLEHLALKRLNDGIKVARDEGDNGTRDLLERILVSEEHHVDWLEAQLALISQIGLENYLARQI